MASRKTIYLNDAAEKIIGTVDDSLSGRINSIIVRYGAIMAKECPELATNEWMMICDILNGTILEADSRDADPARFLWADIAESGQLDGMAAKWEIDTDALSQKVRNMAYSQQVAIVEVICRFWKGHSNNDSYAEVLKDAGAKIS